MRIFSIDLVDLKPQDLKSSYMKSFLFQSTIHTFKTILRFHKVKVVFLTKLPLVSSAKRFRHSYMIYLLQTSIIGTPSSDLLSSVKRS